ncbi:hypothetical protein [Mesonia aestuariivivens]|uniref:Uncharacterized protein n=1 Tax=Mesonia aestuariivivens TaxID=2796128 RepID=A0ABS6W7D6_9FLAO|nr:hypothetical protein [Mesonia aestuariivivens]MBW2963029.1 hypothetical protein [Mesonia aestuariivivens]
MNHEFQQNSILSLQSIQNTLNQHQIELEENLTHKALHQIITIFDIKSKVESNYFSNLNYFRHLYDLVNKKNLHQRHVFYHIDILQRLSYAYFRSRNFENFEKTLHDFETVLTSSELFLNQFKEDLLLSKFK